MTFKPRAGVSLIEVLVAMAVLGVLLAVAAPSFADILNRMRVKMIASELSNDLAYARAEAGLGGKRNNVMVVFNVPPGMSCYTIYYSATSGGCNCSSPVGSACTGQTAELKTVQIPGNIGVSINLSGTFDPFEPNTIAFQHPQMTSSVPGFAATVTGLHGAKLDVRVNTMGRVSTCSPSGSSMNGVPSCI